MGTLALDSKLMESLQSYRVSFALLPLIAKKDNTPSPSKTTKPAANQGGKGANLHVQKPWLKAKGGKKGGKGKVRVPNHIFKLGGTASNPSGEAICFGFNSSSGARKQQMEQNVDEVFIFVRSVTECTVSRSMSRLDSLHKQIMVRALHVIHQNDVWKVQTIFLLHIFPTQLRRVIHAESVLMTATQLNNRPIMTWQRRLTLLLVAVLMKV